MHSKQFLFWTRISTVFLVIFQALSPLLLALATYGPVRAEEIGTDNTIVEEITTPTPSLSPIPTPTPLPEPSIIEGGGLFTSEFSTLAEVVRVDQIFVVEDTMCMEDWYLAQENPSGNALNCTANDVYVAYVDNIIVSDLDGGCVSYDDTVTFTADWHVQSTADNRYDVGLFFSTDGDPDGDGAYTGECTVVVLDPEYSTQVEPWFKEEVDFCGDIGRDLEYVIPITLTVQCADINGDNELDLPYGISWDEQFDDYDCILPTDAVPGNPAKCVAEKGASVPITVPYNAYIEVVKDLEPDTDLGVFDLLIDGEIEADDVSDNGTTGMVAVGAGTSDDPGDTHIISELAGTDTSLADYDSYITCVDRGLTTFDGGSALTSEVTTISVDVDKDDDIVCTITNTRLEGKLNIVKDVEPDDQTTNWVMSVTGPVNYSEILTGDDSTGFKDVKTGSYTITETAGLGTDLNDYNSTYSCTGTQSLIEGDGTQITGLDISDDDSITCTFTNTLKSGTLTLVKTVINDNGGTALFSDFPLYVNNELVTSGETNTYLINTPLSIREDNLTGYEPSDWVCNDKVLFGNIVTLLPGDDITCEITNDDIPPVLTVKKHVINDDDGVLAASDFTINVTGTNVSPATFNGSETGVIVSLNAGTYNVTEVVNPDYAVTYSSGCSGIINIGEVKECLITNDDKDYLPLIEVVKSVTPLSLPEPGGLFTYTYVVKNLSTVDPVTITSLSDSKFSISGDTDCMVGTLIPVGKSCTFTQGFTVLGNAGLVHTNVFTAVAKDNEWNLATDDDDATITLYDVPSSIDVLKTPSVNEVPETGANVTFTFKVTNTSTVDQLTITSLYDDVFLKLDGDTDCHVGTVLAPQAFCEFSITEFIDGDFSGDPHHNTFTAEAIDDDGITICDKDDALVRFTNVLPYIEVIKTANPTIVPETGGSVLLTFEVKNVSAQESVTITSLTDSVFGILSGDADCKVDTVLASGASCTFTLTEWIEGNYSGPSHHNVFTAIAVDNDGSVAKDDDDATVDFIDVLPTILVTKTADPTVVMETGENVIFTFVVKNTSSEEYVTITSLEDSVFGTLSGDVDCKVDTVLASGASCTFTLTEWIEGDYSGPPHYNVFTAEAVDNDGSIATDDDDATVEFSNVQPTIEVTKTADPTEVWETGENVLFTFVVKNTSTEESVTITSLTDSVFGKLSGDADCMVDTVLASGASCNFTQTEWIEGDYSGPPHYNVFTAVAVDNDNEEAKDDDSATVTFLNVLPTIMVLKTPDHDYVPETGADVIFNFVVTNTSSEEWVKITSLSDSVFGTLSGDTDCHIDTILSVGASCDFSITKWIKGDYEGLPHINTFTAHAVDNDGTDAVDSDDASVDFTDVTPTIMVTKTADPTAVDETGGDVLFTFTVQNTSIEESVTIMSLKDSVYGTLVGDADCQIGTVLVAGASCEFSITRWVKGDYSGPDHVNVFTAVARDNDGSEATDNDDAIVDFLDVKPTITVVKTANPISIPEPAGLVDFTVVVTNTSLEDVIINSLVDDIYGNLNGQGDCVINVSLIPNATYTCTFKGLVGPDPGIYTDVVTAIAVDNDGSKATDDDDAVVEVTYVPTLKLQKVVINDNGGTAINSDWTLYASGDEYSFNVFGDSDVFNIVDPKIGYFLSESGPSGYAPSNWICDGGILVENVLTLAPEDDVTCVITNDDIAPKLTLNKIVVNDNGGVLPESSWYLSAKGSLDDSTDIGGFGAAGSNDVVSDSTFQVDTYTLSESGVTSGYTASLWSCVINDDKAIYLTDATIELDLDDVAVCSITNDDQPGTLIIEKELIQDDGAIAEVDDFGFSVNQASTIAFESDGRNEMIVDAGIYNIIETGALDGFDVTYTNCSNVSVLNGGSATCTITNDDIPGKITVTKFSDLNGDGDYDDDEYPLEGWEIKLDAVLNGVADDTRIEPLNSEPQLHFVDYTSDNGEVYFEDLFLTDYLLSETQQDGWYLTGLYCIDETGSVIYGEGIILLSLYPGADLNCFIGNLKLGEVTVIKYADENGNGDFDEGSEPKLKGWGINLSSTDNSIYLEDVTDEYGEAYFNDLMIGDYYVSEDQQDDWLLSDIDCYPLDEQLDFTIIEDLPDTDNPEELLIIYAGADMICYVGNKLKPTELLINKYKDAVEPMFVGDVAEFTLTLTMLDCDYATLQDIHVTDLFSEGFKYNSGSWTATMSGSYNGLLDIPEPSYNSPGVWDLSYNGLDELVMYSGDVIELTYTMTLTDPIEPGTYKDTAWAWAWPAAITYSDDPGYRVLAKDEDNRFTDDFFVGQSLLVDQGLEPQEVIIPEEVLPQTGSNIMVLITSISMAVLGFSLIILGISNKFSRTAFKYLLSIIGIPIILSLAAFAGAVTAFASPYPYLDVQIEQPEALTNLSEFDVTFVAMDLLANPITATCYYSYTGPGLPSLNNPFAYDGAPIGTGGSRNCRITSAMSVFDGTYEFYVIAQGEGEPTEVESEHVTVVIDRNKPLTPVVYNRVEVDSCTDQISFTTASDGGRTTSVEIFRSTSTSFIADASTRIDNIFIGSDSSITLNYTRPVCGGTYYYVIQAVDDYGNRSGFTGDKIVTIIIVPSEEEEEEGENGTVDTTGEDTGTEGEIEGEGTEVTVTPTIPFIDENGDGIPDGEIEGATTDNTEGSFNYSTFWVVVIGGLAVLGGIVYALSKKQG